MENRRGQGRGATDDLLRFAVRKNARFLNVLERTKVASVISDGNRINTVFSDDVWYNKPRYMLYDSYTTILPNKRIMADTDVLGGRPGGTQKNGENKWNL